MPNYTALEVAAREKLQWNADGHDDLAVLTASQSRAILAALARLEAAEAQLAEYGPDYLSEVQRANAAEAQRDTLAEALRDIESGDWQRYPNREQHGETTVEGFARAALAEAGLTTDA